MDLARENILQRVRLALRAESHRPPMPVAAPLWPPVGDSEARFRSEFELLRGELIPADGALREFLASFHRIATDGSKLVVKTVGNGNASVRDADLGVTGCECIVAQTGSVVVSTLAGGSRALSVLPPVHLVIATRQQIVPDLGAAMFLLQQRYGRRWPSSLSVITGPSRTADIEKILVLGAHGPKRLALYFAS